MSENSPSPEIPPAGLEARVATLEQRLIELEDQGKPKRSRLEKVFLFCMLVLVLAPYTLAFACLALM